jgi:AcrR family transcriptional regulator
MDWTSGRQVATQRDVRKPPVTRVRKSEPAPGPRSRAERKQDTRDQIRRAAWELFTRDGFDATTTKAIAERAGVAAGTLFVHASDKTDLLFLVMHDRLAETVEQQLRTLPAAPFVDRLMHVFRGLFRMYAEHPDMGAAFVRSLPGAKGPNADRVNGLTFAFLHKVAALVVEAQSAGELGRDVDPLVAAQNVFAAYFMALLGWLGGYTTLEVALDPALRGALLLQVRGLRP